MRISDSGVAVKHCVNPVLVLCSERHLRSGDTLSAYFGSDSGDVGSWTVGFTDGLG